MNAPKRYEFDGNGYITNVGMSRYWGVHGTKGQRKTGVTWKIRCEVQTGGRILHIKPNWAPTEVEAAWIAASFYEHPVEDIGIERVIPSKDGEYEYRVNSSGEVRKFDAKFGTSQRVYPVTGNRAINISTTKDRQEQIVEQLAFMIENGLGDEIFFNSIENLAKIGKKYCRG